MYRFDETDPACRSPQGALPHGQSLTVTFRYLRGQCEEVYLMWQVDEGTVQEQPMNWRETSGADDVFSFSASPDYPGLYWYWFKLKVNGTCFVIDRHGPGDSPQAPYQITVYDKTMQTPDWIKGGIMYHIFVDRFAASGKQKRVMKPGTVLREDWGGIPRFLPDAEGIVRNNDFFGGDLEGIIGKLPYLQSLGVNCLYLSPIFEADSNHKYDTGDYSCIDPGFGDSQTLARLCIQAGKLGMRVILDGVFSHVGADSVYFNRYGYYNNIGAYQSEDSPYHAWFTFTEWPDVYESWWGIQLLPAIDKREASFRDFITGPSGIIEQWMQQGISGWRLDVVDELPDSFLDPLCASIRNQDPDALIVGEVWEDASNKIAYGTRRRYFLGGQLDSVMNYPLKDAILCLIRDKNVERIAEVMGDLVQNYPKPALDALMNILGTHDTMRILTALGGDQFPDTKEEMSLYRLNEQQRAYGKQMLRIASALQFTLPGFPCIYYGDEAGMEGGADPFNRVCYPWGHEDVELLEWYKLLTAIRRGSPVFREGAYQLVSARQGVFAFTRSEGGESVLIAANVGDDDHVFPFAGFRYDLLQKKELDVCSVASRSVAILT